MSYNHQQQQPINKNQTSCFIKLKEIGNNEEKNQLIFQATKTKLSTLNAVHTYIKANLDCDINLKVDQNEELLKQLQRNYDQNILDFFVCKQEKIIYYEKQNEENLIQDDEQQKEIVCQDSSFMTDKMANKQNNTLEKKTASTLNLMKKQSQEKEQDLISSYSSVSSISTIIQIKCTNKDCNMAYNNSDLKKMLTSSIEKQQLAICDKCKNQISSKMCLKLGMIGQLYVDWKLQLEICQIQQQQIQKNKNDYLNCKNCDFFCRKQDKLEQNLKKLFCPNCLIYGSLKQ